MIPPSIIFAGILAFVAFTAGWQVKGWKEGAAQAAAQREAAETYRKTVEGWAAATQIITAGREAERQRAAADRRDFTRRLTNDKPPLVECPAPSAAAGGDPRLSAAAVGLWNDALAIGLPSAVGAGKPDAAPAAARPATVGTALANVADNAEVCNGLRRDLMAWQAWARSIGAAK